MRDELETLYLTTYAAVVRFLYRKVWDADRAEDLAQEVFVRAMRHRPEKPRAWVFAVAANLARDEARSAIRRKKHLTLLTHEPTQRHQVEPDGEENVEHDEKMEKVRLALSLLTQRDRDVLLLWDAGLSYPEIAEQIRTGRRGGRHDAGPGPETADRGPRPNGTGTEAEPCCTILT